MRKTFLLFIFLCLSSCSSTDFKTEIAKFHPAPTGKITEDIYAIKDEFVNVFVIKKNDSLIVVDGGSHSQAVQAAFAGLELNPAAVKAVLLTHTHFDHVAGAGLFPNAAVYISDLEEKMLAEKKTKLEAKHDLLKDGENFAIGDVTVRMIAVPGHTFGSSCYLIDGKYLFTGDAVALTGGGIESFNKPFNTDTKLLVKSLEKIADLDGISLLITAHYGFTDQARELFAKWRQDPK